MGVFRADGVRFYYRSSGRGEPLVLLHGLGSSSQDWEYQIPAFSKHYRVIAPDLRGFGASDRAGDYRVERFAADVWRLLDDLNVENFYLLGYSMGGAVAQQMALDRGARVRKLVLSNTLPSFRADTWVKRGLLWSRLMLMSLLGPRRLSRSVALKLFPRPDQAALREKVARRNAGNDKTAYLRTVRALVRWSVWGRVGALSMPVLVLAAEHDYFSRAETEALVAALPQGRLQIFPGTRHGLPLEVPRLYNRAVLDFLSAPEAGSR